MVLHPTDVLEYWFGRGNSAEERRRHYPLWFQGGEKVDREIRERFLDTIEAAAAGRLVDWALTPRGRLALIVVLDQFSRNVYRNTPAAFSQDTVARELTLEGLRNGHARALGVVERAFLYMPLEHDESLRNQQLCVWLFEELLRRAPWDEYGLVEGFLDYARRHEAIVRRFGRFPHRNAILGRESTPEEVAFLKLPGSSF